MKQLLMISIVIAALASSAYATSIPFTGQFGLNPTNSAQASLSGPSFSMSGGTFDGSGSISPCAPGETCNGTAEEDLWIHYGVDALFNNVIGTLDGVSGFMQGPIHFEYTFTAPALNSDLWGNLGEPGVAFFYPGTSATFSGSLTALSCTAVGGPIPCWSGGANYSQFSVDLSGTATVDYVAIAQNSNVDVIGFDMASGTATVTYLNAPTPEPSALLLMPTGLALVGLMLRKGLSAVA